MNDITVERYKIILKHDMIHDGIAIQIDQPLAIEHVMINDGHFYEPRTLLINKMMDELKDALLRRAAE